MDSRHFRSPLKTAFEGSPFVADFGQGGSIGDMKRHLFVPLVAVVAGAAGFLGGIWWKGEATVPAGPAAGSRVPVVQQPVPDKAASGREAAAQVRTAVESFAGLSTRADSMTTE